jgi:hypothetical protein
VEKMQLQAVALLDPTREESWLSWAQRYNLMPETEAERVRAVQAEEEHQRRAERKRQEVAREQRRWRGSRPHWQCSISRCRVKLGGLHRWLLGIGLALSQ